MKKTLWIAMGIGLAIFGFSARESAQARPNARAVSYATRKNPERLSVDARGVIRGLTRNTMVIPVRPGPFTFVFPKWIPGYHSPAGPLSDLSEIRVTAHGHPLTWRRGKVDLYAFHVKVPEGVHHLIVRFTAILNGPGRVVATPHLAVLNWNRLLFYQNDTNSHADFFRVRIRLPKGWHFGTALPHPVTRQGWIRFGEVNLATLIDSPLDTGLYFRRIVLWHHGSAHQVMDLFADQPQDLEIPQRLIAHYKQMTPEALALYGARHWYEYHSLLALSNTIGFQGIEHHQSSDDRAPADFMTNPLEQMAAGDLLTHEFSHSWNGKYRRPADLTTPNFQIPQKTDLLWVYEGMNQYLGDLLSFRTGIRKPSEYPSYLAMLYSEMATEPGRFTDPLIDTTTAAPFLYGARGDYPSLRRTAGDFYTEGELLWLDVDTIIRTHTHDRKSLDTFLHLYAGPPSTGPITVTYTRAMIEGLLNRVVHYPWHAFFERHVYDIAPLPPTGELRRSGWRLVYTAKPNRFMVAQEKIRHDNNQWLTYGIRIGRTGVIFDVRKGSPAWRAGLAPGMKIRAVNGQKYSVPLLNWILKQSEHTHRPTVFLVETDGWYGHKTVSYFGGPRFPHLVRIPGTVNLLARIMAPHAHT
ncbi:MAG: M61 family metallopeptidase [Gammaproteobacteria bacterium]